MNFSTSNPAFPQEKVARILASEDEICDPRRVCYYPDIETLAKQVRGSKNWTMGEVFVYAESPERFIIMKQVAPSSCEMFTVTQAGFCDVLTGYLFEQVELVELLTEYINRSPA